MSEQDNADNWRKFLNITSYRRVIKLSKTPDTTDFIRNAALVTATVIVAGLVGVIIFVLMDSLPM